MSSTNWWKLTLLMSGWPSTLLLWENVDSWSEWTSRQIPFRIVKPNIQIGDVLEHYNKKLLWVIQRNLGHAHPTIYNFLTAVHLEQVSTEGRIHSTDMLSRHRMERGLTWRGMLSSSTLFPRIIDTKITSPPSWTSWQSCRFYVLSVIVYTITLNLIE